MADGDRGQSRKAPVSEPFSVNDLLGTKYPVLLGGFLGAHYHRCELPIGCGEKLITNIIAACGADLAKQGFPLLDEKEILEKINALTKVLWTDADRASFNRAQQERAEQAERARLAEVVRAQEVAAAAEQAERQRKQEIADAVVAALAAQR